MSTDTAYTLDQFLADTRATIKTKGIPGLPEGQLYIKRLVALGAEHVRIGNDQHLIIDGQRLDALRSGLAGRRGPLPAVASPPSTSQSTLHSPSSTKPTCPLEHAGAGTCSHPLIDPPHVRP
jgi:hypothetical protein